MTEGPELEHFDVDRAMNQWLTVGPGPRHVAGHTVPIRRNLTGNAFANGNGTDAERVQERERNGYRTGSERIQNGYRTEMERIQNGYESQKSKKAF